MTELSSAETSSGTMSRLRREPSVSYRVRNYCDDPTRPAKTRHTARARAARRAGQIGIARSGESQPDEDDVVYLVDAVADQHVASWSADGSFTTWDPATCTALCRFPGERRAPDQRSPTVLPNGNAITWGHEVLRIWDIAGQDERGRLGFKDIHMSNAAMVGDHLLATWGHRTASGQAEADGVSYVALWGSSTFHLITAAVIVAGRRYIDGLWPLSDGRIAFWLGGPEYEDPGTICIWSPGSNAPQLHLVGHEGRIEGVLELPGQRLLSWSRDGTLRAWSLAPSGQNSPFAASEDVANVSGPFPPKYGGYVRIVNLDDHLQAVEEHPQALDERSELSRFEGHTGYVLGALVLDDDGVISWSWDGTIRLWNISGYESTCWKGHTQYVAGVMRCRDGQLLSWSGDGTIRLWNLTTTQELERLEISSGAVMNVRPLDDRRVVWISSGGSVGILDTEAWRTTCSATYDLTWASIKVVVTDRYLVLAASQRERPLFLVAEQ